jgi:hypothetical protein
VALQVLARRLALQAARGAREEAQVVHHEGDLVVAERLDRLAGVGGLQLGQLLGVGLDRVGDPQQGERALGRGGARPALEGGAGGGDGAVDVGGARVGRLGDLLARRRVQHRLRSALGGLHRISVDEVAQRGHGPNVPAP